MLKTEHLDHVGWRGLLCVSICHMHGCLHMMKPALHICDYVLMLNSSTVQFCLELGILRSQTLKLLLYLIVIAVLSLTLLSELSLFDYLCGDSSICLSRIRESATEWIGGMYTAEMLVQVLLSRETFTTVALAIDVGTVQLLSWTSMFVVDFALVS